MLDFFAHFLFSSLVTTKACSSSSYHLDIFVNVLSRYIIIDLNFSLMSILCSITGIYISIVSVAATFIRGQLFGATNTIMFDELPQVDALWRFLNDIYLLRIVGEFLTENDYFDRMIYIYRNPQVLLHWTKEITDKK